MRTLLEIYSKRKDCLWIYYQKFIEMGLKFDIKITQTIWFTINLSFFSFYRNDPVKIGLKLKRRHDLPGLYFTFRLPFLINFEFSVYDCRDWDDYNDKLQDINWYEKRQTKLKPLLESDVKVVIVMRNDLNMRKGKMIAQASHGVYNVSKSNYDTEKEELLFEAWHENGNKKIAVSVNSEQELLEIAKKLDEKEIEYQLVRDKGLTEFKGVETITCLVISPQTKETLEDITSDLKLL